MNFQLMRKTMGQILCLEAGLMLPPLLLSLCDGDMAVVKGFACGAAILLLLGLPFMLVRAPQGRLGSRDGAVTVALSWIIISIFGAIPYYVSGVIPSVSDAIFETVSGFSTTGTTVLADVETVERGILLWRSLTHWIGGMGVLIFVLAIAPVAREGGSMFLLRAEFPGPMTGKLVPRMQKSAKLLYEMYILMTVVQTLLLIFGGVSVFDSVNISLSTVSTGGFAVKNDSLMSYSLYVQIVTAVFMAMCSISFSVFYLIAAGELIRLRYSEELKCYFAAVISCSIIIGLDMAAAFDTAGECIHHTVFQVISLMSTTGYLSVDSSFWTPFAMAVFVLLMVTGPMAGSTGGGMKLSRVIILLKGSYRATAKSITPGSVHLVHLNGEIVDEDTVSTVNAFAALYAITILMTALVLSLDGLNIEQGLVVGISCIGNIGLGLDNNVLSGGCTILSKAVLCFDMFLGRLELFPMLVLFAPATWRK